MQSGVVLAIITYPDVWNTYYIIGICGISRKFTPIRFQNTEATVEAELFVLEIEASILKRFLRPGDILVLDNPSNHKGKENIVLKDWMLG